MEEQKTSRQKCAVFFDSGIGGLNLLYNCVVRAPKLHYYYISDSANVPYGNKPDEEIFALTCAALEGIEKLNPDALVIACNTVTAKCIARLRERFAFPVVGIQPAVKQAQAVGGSCLVLATRATARSESFKALLAKLSGVKYIIHASGELASYIEENVVALPKVLPEGLLPDIKVDSVVLGCTHYAYIKEQVKNSYNCPVFDGLDGTTARFLGILGINNHQKPLSFGDNNNFKFKPNITFIDKNKQFCSRIFDLLYQNKL